MNFRQKLAIAVIDMMVLGELAFSLYLANLNPENFTVVFFKYFFGMLIPTLILARIVVKGLRTEETELQRPAE